MSLEDAEAVQVKEEPNWEGKTNTHALQVYEVEVEWEREAAVWARPYTEREVKEIEPVEGPVEFQNLKQLVARQTETVQAGMCTEHKAGSEPASEEAAQAGYIEQKVKEEPGSTGHTIKEELMVMPEELFRPKMLGSKVSIQAQEGKLTQNEQPMTDTARNENSIISQTTKKPHKCAYCTYVCAKKSYLIIHERTHTREQPYKCGYCSYATAHKGVLHVHERKHTGEKPYKCAHCSYVCAKISHLKTHDKTHTGEKPHQCGYCSYSSARKQDLHDHERTHTGDMPHKCARCSYACVKQSHLKAHERTHTGEKPHKCAQCNYTCIRKGQLKIHERTHTGEKPFHCPQCSFSCAYKSYLKLHIENHSDRKQYECAHCNFASVRKHNLSAHIQRVH